MKPATAASRSRGGVSPSVSSIVASSSDQRSLEQLVEHLVLGAEVVIDEPVGDTGLVGDVGDAGGVKALAREHPHRGVEDLAALVDGGLGLGSARHQARTSSGQR